MHLLMSMSPLHPPVSGRNQFLRTATSNVDLTPSRFREKLVDFQFLLSQLLTPSRFREKRNITKTRHPSFPYTLPFPGETYCFYGGKKNLRLHPPVSGRNPPPAPLGAFFFLHPPVSGRNSQQRNSWSCRRLHPPVSGRNVTVVPVRISDVLHPPVSGRNSSFSRLMSAQYPYTLPFPGETAHKQYV